MRDGPKGPSIIIDSDGSKNRMEIDFHGLIPLNSNGFQCEALISTRFGGPFDLDSHQGSALIRIVIFG